MVKTNQNLTQDKFVAFSVTNLGAGYSISRRLGDRGKYIYELEYTEGDKLTKKIGSEISSDSIKEFPGLEKYQIVYMATGGTARGLQRLDPMLFTEEFTEGMMKFATELVVKKKTPDEKIINWLVKYLKALSDRYVEYKQLVEQQNRKA